SVAASAISVVWIGLLAALVVRCKMSGQPFPALAKFSPFHNHFVLTDRCLTLFPAFALIAALLLGAAWYFEHNFRPLRTPAAAGAALPRLLVPHLRVYPQTRSFSRGIAGSNAAVFRDLSGKELRGQGCAGTGAIPHFSDELGAELSAQRARPGAGPKTRRWKD